MLLENRAKAKMEFTSTTWVNGTAWSFEEQNVNRIIMWKDTSNKLVLESESTSAPYQFTYTKENTKTAPGVYRAQGFLNDEFVENSTVTILPNLEHDDPRGTWTINYENLKSAYERLSSREADEVSLYDGTRVKYADREILLKHMLHAEAKMNEEIGRRVNRKILPRFY